MIDIGDDGLLVEDLGDALGTCSRRGRGCRQVGQVAYRGVELREIGHEGEQLTERQPSGRERPRSPDHHRQATGELDEVGQRPEQGEDPAGLHLGAHHGAALALEPLPLEVLGARRLHLWEGGENVLGQCLHGAAAATLLAGGGPDRAREAAAQQPEQRCGDQRERGEQGVDPDQHPGEDRHPGH